MAMIATVAQVAEHLRIDDITAESDSLEKMIKSASAMVLDYVEQQPNEEEGYEYPDQMYQATLLLVGDMYRYRDGGSPNYTEAALPSSVRALLHPLKTFGL